MIARGQHRRQVGVSDDPTNVDGIDNTARVIDTTAVGSATELLVDAAAPTGPAGTAPPLEVGKSAVVVTASSTVTSTTPIYTKHSAPANQKSSGKVVGSAVGAGLGLILVLILMAIITIMIRRRRRHRSDKLGAAMDGKSTNCTMPGNDMTRTRTSHAELGAAMDGKSTNCTMPGNDMTQTRTSHAILVKPKDSRIAGKAGFHPSDLLPGPPIARQFRDPGQAT
ncbi:hypothetical protein H1R20_g3075, partial [Candolleomyces eurysporus]